MICHWGWQKKHSEDVGVLGLWLVGWCLGEEAPHEEVLHLSGSEQYKESQRTLSNIITYDVIGVKSRYYRIALYFRGA